MAPTKWLHIARHGKSTWDYDNIADFDRPLKERGINDAYKMALRFKSKYDRPDLITTSPAARAIHTAIIYARTLEVPLGNLEIEESIYATSEDAVFEQLKLIDDSVNSHMIVGHNPTFTDLANFFYPEFIPNISTSGMVSLAFETDKWELISKANVKSYAYDFPKLQ